jgi:large subunit ribosomal protein L6
MYTNMAKRKPKKNTKEQKGISKTLEIPSEITIVIDGNKIKIRKNGKELERELNLIIDAKTEGNNLILSTKRSTKREGKIMGSNVAHIKNIIKGLNQNFAYRLQVANVHFPITIEHDKTKNIILIKNFLGEKTPRIAKVLPKVNVKIIKDIIELDSEDIENAGQTAANIEKATKIRNRDRRVFQDGIYIIEKPGRSYL